MTRVKKVNGFLITRLNQREQRDYGFIYGVIDPDLYTGDADIDRGCMEYDGIDTLKEAIEKAQSL